MNTLSYRSTAMKILDWIGLSSLERIEARLALLGGFFLFFMMLLITSDILLRTIFNSPIQLAFELVEVLMVFLIFLSFPNAQRQGGFVRIELLTDLFPKEKRRPFEYINYIISIIFFIIFCWRSSIILWDSYMIQETTRGLVPLLVYPARAAIFVGGALMLIELVVELVNYSRRS